MGLFLDKYNMLRGWAFSSIVLLTIIVLTVSLLTWGNHDSHVSCLRLSEQTGHATRYAGFAPFGECYINVNNHWIPSSTWRTIDG